ncbi:MAG: late competence development ComFB family protein [Oculatellaceae cyanobacterium Prado106]|jgi:hypothetical protein|nr:late competence development ComFB family protein [Oculatellaceae cyanobacterium Prado106]
MDSHSMRTVGTYINVMELLAQEAIAQQLQSLQSRAPHYTRQIGQINQIELIACALNQLPPLYATSEKGLEYQIQRGRSRYASQIDEAVRLALATTLKTPLRNSAPLKPKATAASQELLDQLRSLLNRRELSWENLPIAIEQALQQAAEGKIGRGTRQSVYAASRGISGYRSAHRSNTEEQTVVQTKTDSPWDNVYRY